MNSSTIQRLKELWFWTKFNFFGHKVLSFYYNGEIYYPDENYKKSNFTALGVAWLPTDSLIFIGTDNGNKVPIERAAGLYFYYKFKDSPIPRLATLIEKNKCLYLDYSHNDLFVNNRKPF